MLTSDQKNELRTLLDAVAPGPWHTFQMEGKYFPRVGMGPPMPYHDGSGNTQPSFVINDAPDRKAAEAGYWSCTMDACQATARLIVFLRNHAEDLLAEG